MDMKNPMCTIPKAHLKIDDLFLQMHKIQQRYVKKTFKQHKKQPLDNMRQ